MMFEVLILPKLPVVIAAIWVVVNEPNCTVVSAAICAVVMALNWLVYKPDNDTVAKLSMLDVSIAATCARVK